jgi:hypothetical protein
MNEPRIQGCADDHQVGDFVFHLGKADDVWRIDEFRSEKDHSYAFCSQNGSKQWLPTATLAKNPAYVAPEAGQAPAVQVKTEKAPKKQHIGDSVAALLAEADNLDQCWVIAKIAGLDIEATKAKIGHLSNGLQRMGIGNRLRAMHKAGTINADDLLPQVMEALK